MKLEAALTPDGNIGGSNGLPQKRETHLNGLSPVFRASTAPNGTQMVRENGRN